MKLPTTALLAAAPLLTLGPIHARAGVPDGSLSFRPVHLGLEQDEPASAGAAPATRGAEEEDKSGTDPTKFLRAVRLTNEFAVTPSDDYVNTLAFNWIQPFADNKMNLRLKVPMVMTDLAGDGDVGLGDVSLRWNWLASVTKENALLLGAELTADSATEDFLGRGKWIAAPLATYAVFLGTNAIFAPTYQHNLSFAGDSDRRSVNESVLDFYFVYTSDDKRSWITVDPALVIDWQNEQNTPFTVEVQLGRRLGTLFGGALNGYVQPGVGIGQDRPYDWNIEIGINVTGF